MSFKIGSIRFDRVHYNTYTVTFKDVSGLSRKAQVKIAGVNVGWVEDLALTENGSVRATIMIHRDYIIHDDAYALVRQDGLIGPKYLEIITGNPLRPKLANGSTLRNAAVAPASVDEILQQVQSIASHIEQVTATLQHSFGCQAGSNSGNFFENLHQTVAHMASITEMIDRYAASNGNIEHLFKLGNNFERTCQQLEGSVFPSFQESIEKISRVFDRDFNRVASKLESSIDSLEETANQVRDGFKKVESIAEKIDSGKGFIGNLINDDQTYHDLQYAAQGLKSYFSHVSMMQLVFDSHFESMYRPAEFYTFADSKGYFDIRIHPNEDHFYLIQFAASEKGIMFRKDKKFEFSDRDAKHLINLEELDLPDWARVKWQYFRERETFKRNTLYIGVQYGKIFGNIAVRFGLFDGYFAGVAADLEVPFDSDKFRWLMTFEAYDLRGWNRERDRRPHLKWLNKIYFLRNMYAAFGADDFVSQRNANIFLGAGIRFGDDDVKYFLPSLTGLLST